MRKLSPRSRRFAVRLLVTVQLLSVASGQAYFEGFDQAGRPPDQRGMVWDYCADLSPVAGWKEIIPGEEEIAVRLPLQEAQGKPLRIEFGGTSDMGISKVEFK